MKITKFYDALSSYGYWSRTDDKVLKDEKGEYQIKMITKEIPCDCHPETCCHFDGKKTISYEEKIYI